MIGGKVQRNAAAEGDGNPRQQPPGAGLGASPFTQRLDEGWPKASPCRREAANRRRSADGPSPHDTLGPYWPARLRHSLHLAIRDGARGYRNVQARE
ncbi:hypothetical protein S23_33470 [Bradyrhizobium cosmicum]|uniref:Uncharacterized protein n=1 Tax=Bradyrhizobium cosmicum TaxID=1404864 RepID=A0AAI8MEN0_9BRAD|nr:hypothetical protein S23_33470 [Bradyrhizobium cosmicum]